ncbi:MAG: Crp/Fnr family transcriptional regulator [Lachnospiraceae bacterium]|nr:Crp/Fnr family transcriptional regulator [Lachnospiraceae bacterium]
MKKYISILKETTLFYGIAVEEISAMLGCLQARKQQYQKGDFVFRQGEQISNIAVLVEGSLHIQRDDYWGNRSIINVLKVGEMFGESYVAPESGTLLNDLVAVENSTILFFDVKRILTVCSNSCRFHSLVVQNLFFAISKKNRSLMQKLGHMSKRTTRDKLMSYLSDEAKRQNCETFEIPFNRQQLADFLSVDRSAMSNELCKMRDDGLLHFEKNRFTLH